MYRVRELRLNLRSVEFVRSVKLLTVRKKVFAVRKLHAIIDTWNNFLLSTKALRDVQCLWMFLDGLRGSTVRKEKLTVRK